MKKERVVYFDILNVLACLSVIGLHCNGLVHHFTNNLAWKESLIVEVLAYWAVPVFLMISGATMMEYRKVYSTSFFLKKRFLKTGIPLCIWTVIFYLWSLYNGQYWLGFRNFINKAINFQVVPVFWFFGPLFLIYFSLPVLSKLVEDRKILKYMIFMSFMTYSVLPFIGNLTRIYFPGSINFMMAGGYLIFPILGYILHTTDFSFNQRIIIYILGILGAVVRYGHTVIASVRDGEINKLTWEYTNWPAILLSVAIFIFIKSIADKGFLKNNQLRKAIEWLSGASFGIYLIHAFLITELTKNFEIDTTGRAWRLLGPFLVYVIGLIIVKVLQKIPKAGKYLFP